MAARDDTSPMADRLALRRHCRRLIRNPQDRQLHLARLQSALSLRGAEPVQGALADVFTAFGRGETEVKRVALQLARGRMSARVVAQFLAQVDAEVLPLINPLATRWSILARPSADITTRARRCSPDDSRWLASQVVHAFEKGDDQAQQEFFLHCLTCHDKLAFMLARRDILRQAAVLPQAWESISGQLEQSLEPTA